MGKLIHLMPSKSVSIQICCDHCKNHYPDEHYGVCKIGDDETNLEENPKKWYCKEWDLSPDIKLT